MRVQQKVTTGGEYGGVAPADVTGDGIPDLLAVKTNGDPKGLEITNKMAIRKAMA